ncbi:PEGA domain-containing protein [Marinilabiliaceae bacterium JC017]|nr:PEGA domain-containing protein [Marinilabiliaceae bacterium JC017]
MIAFFTCKISFICLNNTLTQIQMNRHILFLSIIMATLLGQLKAQEKGTFTISTSPASATVSIDGIPDVTKKTPCTFSQYLCLRYKLRIEKRNYQPLDTIITCNPDTITDYHFTLRSKTGTMQVITMPEGAAVYINDQFVGKTPLNDFPVPCGANAIRLEAAGYGKLEQTYVVDEEKTLQILKDFTKNGTVVNNHFSNPDSHNTSLPTTDPTEDTNTNSQSGFGTIGFFATVGSNGVKGTSCRYGADIAHYLRFFGESNSTSDVSGVGLEGILPLDLEYVAFYIKGGVVSRNYKSKEGVKSNTSFVTLGGGISIKPSPNFQLFGEVEHGMFDEDQDETNKTSWSKTFPKASKTSAWFGLRVAF